ncbi:hypothetical protein EsH8_II_000045 [Colletotrichum jinshuiense]
MTSGSCLCGGVMVTVQDEPIATALCHCFDCRKTSGSGFAINWVIPRDQLTITGESKLKEYTTKALSGSPVTNHFCGSCGTTLWRDGAATQGICYLKAGILDDAAAVDSRKPAAEIFTTRRITWLHSIEGAFQKQELNE